MTTSRRWPTKITAPAAAAALLLGTLSAPATAAVLPQAGFAGYTPKDSLRAASESVIASGVLPVLDGSAPTGSGTTYYVDSVAGDDGGTGTSPATAWRSFAKANATTFQPGDRLLLKAGSTWNAEGSAVAGEAYGYTAWSGGVPTDVSGHDATALLAPRGSGTAAAPIVLSSYGDGAAPELNGRGVVNDVVQLTGQQHWFISNIEVTNITDEFDATIFRPAANYGQAPGEENAATGDLRGIHVQGASAGVLSGIGIRNVFVHDVSGVSWSISASGLDRSKRTGGIVFEGLKGDAQTATQFRDVSVDDSVVVNTSFANLSFRQFSGMGENRYRDVDPG